MVSHKKPRRGVRTAGATILRLRERKRWTQSELARRSGISPTNISLLENNRIEIGKRRTEQLARAFQVHPALIMFPEYQSLSLKKAL